MTRLGRTILVVLLAVGAGLALRYNLRDNAVPHNAGMVVEGKVYRSGWLTPAATREVIQKNHIKTIIDLGAFRGEPRREQMAADTAKSLGVERHVFTHLEGDARGDPRDYVEALRIMSDPAKQPVLVHCSAGSERTGACVMLYRKIFEGKDFDATYAEAQSFGHRPSKNPYLMETLKEHGAAIEREVKAAPPPPAPAPR